jgi:hypothetical protein
MLDHLLDGLFNLGVERAGWRGKRKAWNQVVQGSASDGSMA